MTRTGLFAHAVPPGHTADTWMDEAEALARESDVEALDIFVESVAFGVEHLARMGALARELGLPLRAHVEQLSTMRSVPVALEWGARSVDHLSVIHPDDVAPLAASETAAVLLPGAELMNAEATPPARALADAGAICVLATDFNPGTSPIASLPVIVGLAVRRYGWSVREALLAATAERRLRAGPVRRSSARSSPASAPTRSCSTARPSTSPTASATTRSPRSFAGGELAWVRPDQAWRVRS